MLRTGSNAKWIWTGTISLVLVLVALALPATIFALPNYASATGQACGACHVNPAGGGALTATGTAFAAISTHATDPAGAFAQVKSAAAPAPTAAPAAPAPTAAPAAPAPTKAAAPAATPAAAPAATTAAKPSTLPAAGEAATELPIAALAIFGLVALGAGLVVTRAGARAR